MPFNSRLPLDAEAATKLQHITSVYDSLETTLSSLSDCREKSLIITNLEQSHMWLVKAIEREQLERNFRSRQSMPQIPTPTIPFTRIQSIPASVPTQPEPTLSPDAAIIAESRKGLDGLMSSIKELTEAVAVNGISIGGK